ncbi:serine/threonine-protein kinase [Demequina phytophila]|uniref:serine/threonine-protein kinase n=1 Tax=Demequina phytophila TaxID=1638981 RepID=UPI000785D0CA|nr:serine/threonine-protein kinase [Demequina phytophila]
MAGLRREVGDDVGGYRVLGRLGAGGSGSVYRVADEAGHEAALKLVDARADEVAAARLAREVRALQSLRHPAVPHILDAELDDDETFVVFEFVPGQTLFDHVQRHGPLTGDALAAFADRTASALEAVHAAGVVHRDVTPSNVMMSPAGPVLIDFGLAHRTDDSRLTREGLVSGTPGYVAPEVIDGADPGVAADRWSWAATVAFAMTGHGPFGSGAGAISRTLEGDLTLPDVPGADALRAALGRDVRARPGMRDVVAALRGATAIMPTLPATTIAPTAVAPTAVMERPWEDPDATTVLPSGEMPVDDARDDWVPDLPWEEGPGEDEESPASDELGACPVAPRRRWLLVLAAAVTVVAAPLAPILVLLMTVGVAILARGVYRRAVALDAAVVKRGRRRTTDTVVQTIGLPWHVLRAAGECVPAVLLAAVLGAGVTLALWQLIGAGVLDVAGTDIEDSLALSAGMLVAVVMLAFGPYMAGTRQGAHRMAAAVSPTGGLRAAWALVAVTAMLVSAIALWVGVDTWWWPLAEAPLSAA